MRNNFFFILVILIVLSCDNDPISRSTDVTGGYYAQFINEQKALLPALFSDSSYYIVWRFGSIEKAKYLSGIALSENTINSSKSKCFYFAFDYPTSSAQSNVHLLDLFDISIKNSIQLDNCTEQPINQLDDFINDSKSKGEGRCANLYFITKRNQFIGVDKNLKDLSNSIRDVFSQISQSEHLQTVSFDENCRRNDTLALKIINGNFDYCIEDSVKY